MAIDPHITLVFPFASTLSQGNLLAHIKEVGAANVPFELELRGVTGQQDEWLFLNVKRGNDHLIALHDQLYSGLLAPYLQPRYTYVPHLTVGHLAPGQPFENALRDAASLADTFRTVVHEISAYRISADGTPGEKYSVSLT